MDPKQHMHKQLVNSLWTRDASYYDRGEVSSKDFDTNAGLQKIRRTCQQSRSILDCGCGAGRKLALMLPRDGVACGIDISRLGLKRARRFPGIHLIEGDLENLPFPNEFFEVVLSAYVIEHVPRPESILDEMVRVAKPNGHVMVIAPNYGSPLFPSPPTRARERFRSRGVRRLFQTHLDLFHPHIGSLGWDSVRPLTIETGGYESDWDTIVEPYLHTLIQYLRARGTEVIDYSSQFEMIPLSPMSFRTWVSDNKSELFASMFVRLIRFLARLGISPYKYYGPVCYVMARKQI